MDVCKGRVYVDFLQTVREMNGVADMGDGPPESVGFGVARLLGITKWDTSWLVLALRLRFSAGQWLLTFGFDGSVVLLYGSMPELFHVESLQKTLVDTCHFSNWLSGSHAMKAGLGHTDLGFGCVYCCNHCVCVYLCMCVTLFTQIAFLMIVVSYYLVPAKNGLLPSNICSFFFPVCFFVYFCFSWWRTVYSGPHACRACILSLSYFSSLVRCPVRAEWDCIPIHTQTLVSQPHRRPLHPTGTYWVLNAW